MWLPTKEQLIEMVKELMKQAGISQEEVAEGTGVSQPVISRILKGERELRYDEAKTIIDYLISKVSSIPSNMIAADISTKGETLMKVHVEENLSDVAKTMFEKGYSQAPVYENDRIKGIITEKSFIKLLLEPGKDLRKLRVKDALIEEAPVYPYNTPLRNLIPALLDYYTVLVEKEGRIEGIITRADTLKIFFQ